MSLKRNISKWIIPQGLYILLRGKSKVKDINEFITPVQLRHIKRYEFASSIIQGGKILDAACGSGYGSDLIQNYDEYIGLDYADYCINYADSNYKKNNKKFLQGDIYKLDTYFDENTFDYITSFETLEHIANPEIAIAQFIHVLKPGGKILVSIPMNHPDLIHHKKIYKPNDIQEFVNTINKEKIEFIEEYLQHHVNIFKLDTILSNDSYGTWIAVIRKKK